eukprot:5795298-Pyramimonas_sp.AAC.1
MRANMGGKPHADLAIGAFGRAPYRATKCVSGVPTWGEELHVDPAVRVFGGAPDGNTRRVK